VLLVAVAGASARAPKFGHRPYEVAPASALESAGPYRSTGRVVRLRAEAAGAFRRMVETAKADGVGVVPISGHRTLAYQKNLFENARRKHGSAREAARWVAPPGHSEHHTGWTLDLGDESTPAADVDPAFEGTAAFRWLTAHAAKHGFELSFPPGNPQGVGYEPWHWRYIGAEAPRRLFHPDGKP
jgi:D-alanyl-D-alanine carboxypeptidase